MEGIVESRRRVLSIFASLPLVGGLFAARPVLAAVEERDAFMPTDIDECVYDKQMIVSLGSHIVRAAGAWPEINSDRWEIDHVLAEDCIVNRLIFDTDDPSSILVLSATVGDLTLLPAALDGERPLGSPVSAFAHNSTRAGITFEYHAKKGEHVKAVLHNMDAGSGHVVAGCLCLGRPDPTPGDLRDQLNRIETMLLRLA